MSPTKYSLFPHPIPDLAKPIYHRLHVDLANVLHRLTGAAEFQAAARKWASYDRAVPRAAAVAAKLPFIVMDGRRRRMEKKVT